MPRSKPQFDKLKCRAIIEKGSRARWWQRQGSKSRGFRYIDAAGKIISDRQALERIKSLAIPPAWQFVRVSPYTSGKLQAVGMDTTGRIQYIYHADFTKRQQKKKFTKIERFGERLPTLNEQTNKDIVLEGLPREKVLAVMMRLINSLYFRVGTDVSAKNFRTYGITTLKNEHLSFLNSGQLCFEFTGKSHVKQRKVFVDRSLAAVMRELKKIGPKKKLFNYIDDDGKPRPVKPADINRYIKAAMGDEFSSKDLRTWGASLQCARELARLGVAEDEKAAKSNIVAAIEHVAEELGNTPAVCRSSYIHPAILDAYEAGITLKKFKTKRDRKIKGVQKLNAADEAALLKLFKYTT
jgi:DNA topoisomerase I